MDSKNSKQYFWVVGFCGLLTAAVCGAVEYFVFSRPVSPKPPVSVSASEPVIPLQPSVPLEPPALPATPQANLAEAPVSQAGHASAKASEETQISSMTVTEMDRDLASTAPTEFIAPPAPLEMPIEAEPMVSASVEEKPILALVTSVSVPAQERATSRLGQETLAALPQPEEAPKQAKAVAAPNIPKPVPSPAEPEEEPELMIHVKAGYGAKFVSLQQNGAFGGVKGSMVPMNALSVDTGLKYRDWRVDAGVEKFSADFAADTTNSKIKEEKEFRSFFLKPGYGIFHIGVKAKTAPVVRAIGTSLEWVDITTFYGVAGIRLEKLYAPRKRKPFLFGLDLEGSYPFSIAGQGGQSFSSLRGFGVFLRGYAEKTIHAGEVLKLNIGLEGTAIYEKNQWDGVWGTSSGSGSRTIQEYGSRLYIGVEF